MIHVLWCNGLYHLNEILCDNYMYSRVCCSNFKENCSPFLFKIGNVYSFLLSEPLLHFHARKRE